MSAQKPEPRTQKRLPGDLSLQTRIQRMLRVNHAGEYGARRIYAGQLAILSGSPVAPILRHMDEQEKRHLAYFEAALSKRQIRPTLLFPIWHVAGFALGAATALLGTRAAMACTIAIEETIDTHYANQARQLCDDDDEVALRADLLKFRAEELEHRDMALAQGGEQIPAFLVLRAVIKAGSRAAIWLSERF